MIQKDDFNETSLHEETSKDVKNRDLERFYLLYHLPPALTREEDMILVKHYKEYGDKDAFEKLVYGNLRLVAKFAFQCRAQFENCQSQIYPSFEDLFSEGIMALMSCIDNFNDDKGFAFSTYLAHAVQNKFNQMKREGKNRKSNISLNEKLDEEEDSAELIDMLEDPKNTIEKLHDKMEFDYIVNKILPLLSSRDRHIFTEIAINGESFAEIGRECGYSLQFIRRLYLEVSQEVNRLYFQGPTEEDLYLSGVFLRDERMKQRISDNFKLIKKYGRAFLEEVFMPTLSLKQQKIFLACVLKYNGQTFTELAKKLGASTPYIINFTNYKSLCAKIEKVKKRQKSTLKSDRKVPLKLQQLVNCNKRMIKQYGGELFLRKYFLPILPEGQRKVFEAGVLENDGKFAYEIADKLKISVPNYSQTLKKAIDALQQADMDFTATYIDNMERYGVATEELNLKEAQKRQDLVEEYGEKNLKEYFLPMLSDSEREVFDWLYLKKTFPTTADLAKKLDCTNMHVLSIEKVVLEKLKSTNFEELRKIKCEAENYIAPSTAERQRNINVKNIIAGFGGEQFLREKFLPSLHVKVDAIIFESYVLKAESFEEIAKKIPKLRTDIPKFGYARCRYRDYIYPKLKEFKASFENFEQVVGDFYAQKGFERSHSENFEELPFDAHKEEKKETEPFSDEDIERWGGARNLVYNFMPKLCLSEQTVFLRLLKQKSIDEISQELKIPKKELIEVKNGLIQKLDNLSNGKPKTKVETKHGLREQRDLDD